MDAIHDSQITVQVRKNDESYQWDMNDLCRMPSKTPIPSDLAKLLENNWQVIADGFGINPDKLNLLNGNIHKQLLDECRRMRANFSIGNLIEVLWKAELFEECITAKNLLLEWGRLENVGKPPLTVDNLFEDEEIRKALLGNLTLPESRDKALKEKDFILLNILSNLH
jgi:hypothetical protein